MLLRAVLLSSVLIAGLWSSMWRQPEPPRRVVLAGHTTEAGVSMLLPAGWQPHPLVRDQEPVRFLISSEATGQPYVLVEFAANSVDADQERQLLDDGPDGQLCRDRDRDLTWVRETLARDRRVTVFVQQPEPLTLQFVAPREYIHGFEDSIIEIVDSLQPAERPLESDEERRTMVTAVSHATAGGALSPDGHGAEFRFPTENRLAGVFGAAWVVLGLSVLSGTEWYLRHREHRRRAQQADAARDARGQLWQSADRTSGSFGSEA